jgi:hypothetical protein
MMDDADENGTLMDAESGPSSVFIGVSRDQRPLMCYREPTRYTSTVLIAIAATKIA